METPLKRGRDHDDNSPEPAKTGARGKEDTDIGFTPETKTESESEDRTIGEHWDPVAFKNLDCNRKLCSPRSFGLCRSFSSCRRFQIRQKSQTQQKP